MSALSGRNYNSQTPHNTTTTITISFGGLVVGVRVWTKCLLVFQGAPATVRVLDVQAVQARFVHAAFLYFDL